MQPGRRSASSLSIVPTDASPPPSGLTPLGPLSKAEHRVFSFTVHQNRHLRARDVPLLELYAAAYCRSSKAKRGGVQKWERETRIMMALAVKLRLTVQSTVQPRTVGRLHEQPVLSYYERQALQEQMDDDNH